MLFNDKRSEDFYLRKKDEYPYLAEIPTGIIAPHDYDKSVLQCSVGLIRGFRLWMFKNKNDRDAFVAAYSQARAL